MVCGLPHGPDLLHSLLLRIDLALYRSGTHCICTGISAKPRQEQPSPLSKRVSHSWRAMAKFTHALDRLTERGREHR